MTFLEAQGPFSITPSTEGGQRHQWPDLPQPGVWALLLPHLLVLYLKRAILSLWASVSPSVEVEQLGPGTPSPATWVWVSVGSVDSHTRTSCQAK